MNPAWKDFLEQQYGTRESAPATADCALSDLSDLGLIRVQGEDARSFLQGQLTNDVNLVSSEQSQLSGYCNPKGRLFACFLLFEHAGNLYLQLPRERLDSMLKRLRMFVLMSKVTLTDASDELAGIGLTGDCLPELLDKLPEAPFDTVQNPQGTVLRMPGDTPRVQIWGTPEQLTELWKKLAPTASLVNADFWPLANIRAAYPSILNATAEAFVPQTLNLDLLEAISFTKGCYTGQEVVARMKYLGQLKRRMYLARIDTDQPPQAGDPLYAASSKSGQGAGKVVDARPSPDGGCEALVMTQISSAEAGDLQLGDANGAKLVLSEPPYGFEQE